MLGSGRLRSLVAPCVGLALWSVPSAGLAERAAWDQERVTAIAQQQGSVPTPRIRRTMLPWLAVPLPPSLESACWSALLPLRH